MGSVLGSRVLAGIVASTVLVLGAAAQSAGAADPDFVFDTRFSGETALLPDGDVILLDGEGRGHRLRPSSPELGAALVHYAGWRITLFGIPVQDPHLEPYYPIRVLDFALEPGGSFNRAGERLSGETDRLPDGDVILRDTFGRGHRLRATGAIKAHLEATAGTRQTISGRASVSNIPSRLNWPIDVEAVLFVHATRTGCFIDPPTTSNACFHFAGFGLAPGSGVRIIINDSGSPSFVREVSADGTFVFNAPAGCFQGEHEEQVKLTAVAETPIQILEASDSISLFCERGDG